MVRQDFQWGVMGCNNPVPLLADMPLLLHPPCHLATNLTLDLWKVACGLQWWSLCSICPWEAPGDGEKELDPIKWWGVCILCLMRPTFTKLHLRARLATALLYNFVIQYFR